MKKQIQIYTGLLLLVFTFSCNGQQKTDPEKVSAAQPEQAETNLPETDPYFTESEAITSPYGPKSITRNILQDKKGNIWFATWEGIIQYDGKTFTNFTNKEGLRRFRVFTILEDKMGNIWFGAVGAGVYHYDGKSFTNFTTKDGLVDNRVGCFLETKNGDIWIGTTGGLSKYDGAEFTNFELQGGPNNNDVNSMVEDKTGKLWFGTRGDVATYNGKTFTKFTNNEGQPFVNVRSIIEDKEGNIWLAGNDGLWSYDGSTFTNFNKNFVGYIYQDKEENIWTSSAADSNGNTKQWALTKYDKMAQKNKGATANQIKAEEGIFFGITKDNKGNIWLGTLGGVYRYDGTTFNDFKAPKVPFK